MCTIPGFIGEIQRPHSRSVFAPLSSSPSPPSPFHKTTQDSSEPPGEEKEQNLQEEHMGSVVLLYAGEQHPFDWGRQRSGLGSRSLLGCSVGCVSLSLSKKCLCMHAFVSLECVCWHLCVCWPRGCVKLGPANVTGEVTHCFFLWRMRVT